MLIRIGHLYPKELDLYGENGNIKALKYALEKKGVEVIVENIYKEAELDLKKYDFLYIGSGRKKYLEKVQERLIPYKEDFLKYIKDDKVLLVTGNAISIFSILDLYEVEKCSERKVADVKATSSLCPDNINGFQNTEYLIKSTEGILFNINKGYGNNNTLMEGYTKNNFYATSIIGPLLARNDYLTDYFTNILIENKKEEDK